MNKLKKRIRQFFSIVNVFFKDLLNKITYGQYAPLYFETIWVDPMSIYFMIEREEVLRVTGYHRNRASGVVVDWDNIDHFKSVFDEYRIQYCFKHWKEGLSWEQIGVYEYMSQTKKYGSWPKEKIIERFEVLDQAFKEAKSDRRLKTRKELNPNNFREEDGILVHIGKDGVPYFGGNGFHRLAIAKILELEKIPACIGMVDKDAIHYLKNFRKP